MAARLLRGLLRRFGIVLDRAGTRSALRFIRTAPSGRTLRLAGGARVRTEFGEARIERGPPDAVPPDLPLAIDGERGSGTARIGGLERRVEWRTFAGNGAAPPEGALVVPTDGVRMPLVLRGWMPGDRLRTRGGTKTLKKLFNEARVPLRLRARLPVLADADGAVLWVAGVARGVEPPRPGEPGLTIDLV